MKRPEARAEVAQILKLCPVCGALNGTARRSCCNCSWHGAFELNPAIVAVWLDDIDPESILALEAGLPDQQTWRGRLYERVRKWAAAIRQRLSFTAIDPAAK